MKRTTIFLVVIILTTFFHSELNTNTMVASQPIKSNYPPNLLQIGRLQGRTNRCQSSTKNCREICLNGSSKKCVCFCKKYLQIWYGEPNSKNWNSLQWIEVVDSGRRAVFVYFEFVVGECWEIRRTCCWISSWRISEIIGNDEWHH